MASTWQQLGQRASFANRISTMFDRRRATAQTADSARATTTFEVPLFLSPSRYEPPTHYHQHYEHEEARSRSSTQSLIESVVSVANRVRPLTLPASSRYSSPSSSPVLVQPPVLPLHEPSSISSIHSSEGSTADSRGTKDIQKRRRRRRRNALRLKVQAKKTLSIVFGITLFLTLITYLVLAATGTAAGVMFHVLMILLVLSLTGVFAHSITRFFMLRRHVNIRKEERRRVGDGHGRPRPANGSYFGEVQPDFIEHHDELDPEKPIRITMADDEEVGMAHRLREEPVVQHPPPVYGNFRSSKRINPNLVHWQKVPPSPLTPTYDEAMSDIHRVVGYRPPSYLESESGATRIVEHGTRDVEKALQDIHPLERERMTQFSHNVI